MTSPRDLLRELFDAAVAAADPAVVLPPFLDRFLPDPTALAHASGRLVVVGAGKAAAAMAAAVEAWAEKHWHGDLSGLSGMVVTRYGHGAPTRRIRVVEAAHPVPDAAGEAAAAEMLALVRTLTPNDRLLVLLSGGGSALLAAPLPGIDLATKRALTKELLACGAAIDEINCVRKHLSAVKGGRLAAASLAPGLTLAISDVVGDDPSVIASGPTVPDPSTCADALAILCRYEINVPDAVRALLESGEGESESVKPGDPRLARHDYHLVAAPMLSLHAAANVARAAGVTPLILGDAIAGESREVARAFAGLAVSSRLHGLPVQPPCVLLSGGETTVTLKNPNGRGGRNTEFLLGLAIALQGAEGIWALAGDTDGIDGSEDNAGAVVTPDTLARARDRGVDALVKQDENDAWGFFHETGDLLVTGPTRTNVNDFRAILVL